MAQFLCCNQATISRLENGSPEPGPISRLLDYLEGGGEALDRSVEALDHSTGVAA